MIYARASASDFDEWKNVHKNPGWGAEELTPLMEKVSNASSRINVRLILQQLETFQPAPGAPTHGSTGGMKGSIGNTTQFGLEALEVAKKYDPTRGSALDTNDLKTIDKWVVSNY